VPPRSKPTVSMPAALARSAISTPTRCAFAVLSPSSARRSASRVDAEARVRPTESSTTWATMCRLDRVTTRRGRAAVPTTFLRRRRWRRARATVLPLPRIVSATLLTSLSGLAADDLARVAHALALVRLGLADLADVRCDLADLLLVDPADRELCRALDREADPLGGGHRHRVAEAECELQVRPLGDD